MTLTQLEYIVAVANYGSFSAAAEHCFVTQPTLSMQIQKLEEELGVLLFDRTKQPISATDKGEKILKQAKLILQESEKLKNDVQAASEAYSGRLRVGIIPTISPYLLPMFIKSFTEKFKDVELVIDEITTDEIISAINKDRIDLGILALPLNEPGIIEKELYYEPFVGYVPRSSPLFKKENLDVDELTVDNLLLLKEGHCLRAQTLKICKTSEKEIEGKKNRLLFESSNLDTVKKLVEQDFGLTLLPYLAVQYITEKNQHELIREFAAPVPRRAVGLVYNKTLAKKHLVKALKDEILNVIPETLKGNKESIIIP